MWKVRPVLMHREHGGNSAAIGEAKNNFAIVVVPTEVRGQSKEAAAEWFLVDATGVDRKEEVVSVGANSNVALAVAGTIDRPARPVVDAPRIENRVIELKFAASW